MYERPFAKWLDLFRYVRMPDGGLEDGAEGWKLTGGATCAGLTHPTMRFFVRRTSTGLLSALQTLRVDALYEDASGRVAKLPNVGLVVAVGSKWQPTLPMVVLGSILPPVLGSKAVIAFRFTPSPGSSWRIDDVYLDPFAKH